MKGFKLIHFSVRISQSISNKCQFLSDTEMVKILKMSRFCINALGMSSRDSMCSDDHDHL